MANKTNSDEKIIAALMDAGTIKGAAALLSMGERTIYERMQENTFQELYANAKADLLRAAVTKINAHIEAAIDTTAGIMANAEVNPAIRLQAAQTILNTASKFAERLRTEETETTELHLDNGTDEISKYEISKYGRY